MQTLQITDGAAARQLVEQRQCSHIKVGVFDIDGIMRGKYISKDKFLSALDKGFGFCDVVLGWDSNDQLYDNVQFTGWHTGYPDAAVRIIPESARLLPLENNDLLFLGEFTGNAASICPRQTLQRVLKRAADMDYSVKAGVEYEFFVFNETPDSVREKHYQNLKPMAPGFFGYSMLRNSVHADFYQGLWQLCDSMNMPLEGLHEETGPGVVEAAIAVDDALAAADKAALFKTYTKIFAQQQGRMATFMAKWSRDWPGQSGHIHISLQREGKPVFYDADQAHNMSANLQHFVAGQQLLMPQLMAMIAPTINAYRRLIPGFWAPTHSTWGIENRTCALRVIPGSANSQRVEYRVGAADANPYLALAAAIASGLYGIAQQLSPPEPLSGNAYEQNLPSAWRLPATLWDAAQGLKQSDVARDYFGSEFVEHFAASREWEEREFRKHISDWELQRYFEII